MNDLIYLAIVMFVLMLATSYLWEKNYYLSGIWIVSNLIISMSILTELTNTTEILFVILLTIINLIINTFLIEKNKLKR
jgi:hypothetical protein